MQQTTNDEGVKYHADRYEEIVRLSFSGDTKTLLRDHTDESSRKCRFCRCGKPEVSFASIAHAVPEFLGNHIVLSLNECDSCNAYFANKLEDHLAKWSLFARSASQVKGKTGKPTFRNSQKSLRIEAGKDGLEITITDPQLTAELLAQSGPFAFTLPADASSQPYIPMRAAMTLVKVACSVCPFSEIEQCRPAIDWLMGKVAFRMSVFPVFYAFTPGPINDSVNEVIVMRRKGEAETPYLVCMVQFSNHRLQTFVPFCPADASWQRINDSFQMTFRHCPTKLDAEWDYGKTEFSWMDWSSNEIVQTSATATFHVKRAFKIDDDGAE